MQWVSSWQNFRGFCRKSLPADSRHSNGCELCPASRRHLNVFVRSGFQQSLLSTGNKHLASRFNLTYRYIDDVLSINNPEFENYLSQMYPAELEIKDTTESTTSAPYLDLLLSIGKDCQLHTSIYDKRDDFNFHITNFPFLSSNIPSSPAYWVFISQLIRYSRACSSYECFILRARRLSSKLLKQGYLAERLKSSFRKFYGRDGDLIQQYEVFLSRMLNDILILDQQWLPNQSDFPPISWPWYRAWPSPIMSGFHRAFATGVACQQGTLTLPDTWFRPPFWDLLMLQLLRPNSSNLPCLYSTFHLEYPLVRGWIKKFLNYLHIFLNKRRNYIKLIQHAKLTFPNFAMMFECRSPQE